MCCGCCFAEHAYFPIPKTEPMYSTPMRIAILSLTTAILSSCSSDDRPPPSGDTAGQDSALCSSYCNTLVVSAPGCAAYNSGSRCERICGYYMASVCSQPYEQFVTCMQEPDSAMCAPPTDGSHGDRLTLVVRQCHAEYEEWNQCIRDKNAGVCPY